MLIPAGSAPWGVGGEVEEVGIYVCTHMCVVNRNRESVLYSEGTIRVVGD